MPSTELGFQAWRRASIFEEINSKPSGKVSVVDETASQREAGALTDTGMGELTDEVIGNLSGSTKKRRIWIGLRRAAAKN